MSSTINIHNRFLIYNILQYMPSSGEFIDCHICMCLRTRKCFSSEKSKLNCCRTVAEVSLPVSVYSKMAESSVSLAQNQFNCSICLNKLTDPVTIPCGHSYCKSCITGCWDQDDQKGVYSCPQCRQTFTPRPVLGKNTMLVKVEDNPRKRKIQAAQLDHCYGELGDVECDVCTGSKNKAIKSCLVCLNSYCQTHFERHEEFHPGKRHKVTNATKRLQEMICPQHDKLLEIFCRTDQHCICYLCMLDEHKNHDHVSAAAERTEKQTQLEEMQRKFQQRIQEREKELEELRETVDNYKHSAQTAVEDSERIFTELIHSIERSRSEVTRLIRDQEKAAVSRAEVLLEQLKKEIEDLKRRDAEVDKLSHTDLHIHFLQSFQSLSVPPGSTDSPTITVSSIPSFDDVEKSVSHLREKLEHFCREEIQNIHNKAKYIEIIPIPECKTRDEFLQYFLQFTVDSNTVHKNLHLSKGDREITYTDTDQPYPDHPDRFDTLQQVLCRESVCGRSYWEVEWSGEVEISVSYKSISRKRCGDDNVYNHDGYDKSDFGLNDKSWCLFCSDSSCSFWHNNTETKLPEVSSSSRIGVYVDHGAGTLSFYSVSDTMTHIHRVQTTFTQPLYPGFGVYSVSAVKLVSK
uniref:Tripartite motif-containing protein 16-like n=1 Tax=Cyprinus carpio TaxID=7962 RepID=A0A8C1YYK4_CYPCA